MSEQAEATGETPTQTEEIEAPPPAETEMPEPEPPAESNFNTPQPDEPEPQAEPAPEPAAPKPAAPVVQQEVEEEEEVAAADLYKTGTHKAAAEGAPFNPDGPDVHPACDNTRLSTEFTESNACWVAYKAVSDGEPYMDFYKSGDSIKSMKQALTGAENLFLLVKCKAQDVKQNVVSERVRLISFVQLGKSVKVMKRRYISPCRGIWQSALDGKTSFNLEIEDDNECNWLDWMKEIQKNGGAHQPTQFAFGDDETWKPPAH